MAINPITGAQLRPAPKVVAENVAPSIAQFVGPQDTLGIKTKRQPGKGLAPGTRLADLKPEQLKSLGGGSALESIASAQPGTTVGEVGPLLRNGAALESIAGLMQHRRDLKVGDFVTQDQKGRIRIDPSYKDDKTVELLKERSDITPSEISALRSNMTKTLKNPQLGKQATEKSFELLKKRSDLKPEDMGKLMGSLRQAAGGDQKNQKGGGAGDEAGAHAALDMFDSASKLMERRTDLKPDRVGQLARSVGDLSSPEDKQGPQNVAEGFEAASKGLEKNVLRKPEEMSRMASTLNDHFKGGDEKTAGHRMNAFKKSSEMMGDNSQVDHNSINKMLTQATERDPKLKNGEGPDKAKRLGKVMDDVSTGVKQGTVPAGDLSAHFRNQDAEKARFQVEPKKDDKKKAAGAREEQKNKKGAQESTKPQDGPKAQEEGAKPGSERGKTSEGSKPARTPAPEEEGAKPPARPGEAPSVDPAAAGAAKPGEAAGTASVGTGPSGAPTGAGGGAQTPGTQGPAPQGTRGTRTGGGGG